MYRFRSMHVINAGGLLVTGVLIKNYLVGFMILQIKIEFVAMEFVIFVQEILVTKAQIVVVITLIGSGRHVLVRIRLRKK